MSEGRIQRALISVTDKRGVVAFARGLTELGVEVISTGGTARVLSLEGVVVTPLESFTGWPEMLDGRVKTLHPKVHAGILARRDLATHRKQMAESALSYIDLVVVNLYNFEGALNRPELSAEAVIEEIDIGGPTLLRAAAKNHASVLPVVDPDDYDRILEALKAGREFDLAERRALAGKVFQTTARYDALVSGYLSQTQEAPGAEPGFSDAFGLSFTKIQGLRYGENAHQSAAFYRPTGKIPSGLAALHQHQGKALSYNNILDADSALGLAIELGGISAVFIKHNNPCGAARGAGLAEAVRTARACDATSAFGSVVAVTAPVDEAAATALIDGFVEAIIAPGYSDAALAVLKKKKNLRVLSLSGENAWQLSAGATAEEVRQVRGGMLRQTSDAQTPALEEVASARVATQRAPTEAEMRGLAFSWAVAKHVRSNAIVFGLEDRVIAVGAGQMSRVDSVKLCVLKAGDALKNTVVASDAFFPFRDGVDVLAHAGATAIAQPGGSVRDEEVIAAADEHGIAMVLTGVRHFRH